jgi:hypothetical protein
MSAKKKFWDEGALSMNIREYMLSFKKGSKKFRQVLAFDTKKYDITKLTQVNTLARITNTTVPSETRVRNMHGTWGRHGLNNQLRVYAQIYFKTVPCLSMTTEMSEKMAVTGAVEESSGVAGIAADTVDTNDTNNDNGTAPPTSLAEQLRLAERGVAVHDISGDETEDETLLDEKDDEVEGGIDTPACANDASAALLDPANDQEGLVLTGGDWFKTIKKAAENNVETKKELAERMKKAKISQMSQATLENKVFEGNPPSPALPTRARLCCKKIQKKARFHCPYRPLPPPWLKKKLLLLISRRDVPTMWVHPLISHPRTKVVAVIPPISLRHKTAAVFTKGKRRTGTSRLSTVASGHLEPMLRLYCHWGG